jgi:hypothetical protein
VKINLNHLNNRLIPSSHISSDCLLSSEQLKVMLIERFKQIDYSPARHDDIPFIPDPNQIALWNENFFTAITEQLPAK